MKKLILIIMLCTFFTTPSLADIWVGVDNLAQTGGIYSTDPGGEFTISDSTINIDAYVATVTSGIIGAANSFQTFCVEMQESTANPVDVVISTSGSSGSQAVKGGELVADPLDARTAYLYTKFATGTLTPYDYTNTGVGRATSAADLQNAIWFIEDEGGANNAYVTLANDAITVGGTTDEWVGMGIGGVRVLNIYDAGTYGTSSPVLQQDQLYLVPLPGAVLLGIFGLSVAGIKLRKYA